MYRMSKNLTQRELALKLGVSRTAVTMWELGKADPTVHHLKRMAEILECSVDQLIQNPNN